MAKNAVHEMIAAFAVGCMDRDNFIQFKDYIDAGGELPEGELQEMQNIVSLIPIILDIEKPDPSLKDEVARRLIGMKDEIKTRIREEKKATAEKFSTRTTKAGTKASFQLTNLKKTQPKEKTEEPVKTGTGKTSGAIDRSIIPEEPSRYFTGQQTQIKPAPRSPGKSGSLVGWFAIVLSLVLFSLLGYYSFTSVEELNQKITDIEQDINVYRSELARTNNFVNNYIALIEFFNYGDITIVNLKSNTPGENASAKVLLSFDAKEGLIQFRNVKPLLANQGYQLWLVSRGISYSMGVYQPAGNEFLHITSFPIIPKENIESLKITIESNTGSPTPSVNEYMSAPFPQENRRR
ncbi:anti-sigma factor domain-containing protein [Melioribacter sp. Ez-97]|uniref:anti-sigma factor n=1 Tax=Melioribacter sp. Ez-97 TaxID=3423434 RepID=UPI003EDA3A7C